MKTFAYTKDSLARFLSHEDRLKYGVATGAQEQRILSGIQARINSGGQLFSFKKFTKNSREMCKPCDIETEVLVRKVNHDFLKLTKARVSNRADTISALKSVCSEGQAMTIIRLDIKKFFQNVSTSKVLNCASRGINNTYALRRNIERYLSWAETHIRGVPIGVSLSSSLTEYYLREYLDNNASALPGVHFYRRYVDDIIMVCSADGDPEKYIEEAEKLLPKELKFNTRSDKRDIVKLHYEKDEGDFNYLGYRFKVGRKGSSGSSNSRSITLDVAPSKIAKRKNRFVYTLLQFLKDGSEPDLRRRFLLLNSGYTFWDSNRGREMSAGLCNNYSEIDHPSEALKELRNFYRSSMLNPKFQLYHRLRYSHLSTSTRRMIISFDLQKHVEERKHFNFSPEELQHLTSCWKK
ncbi:antiviral reverse transcriptase Drt3a [Phaeobacter inhibens]|uniref:antiviral reverse transcriptase Drt3a n=1 Tax=Phaeobacter inhibens TaxID=221822 RepID=UPI0026E1DE4F|nr:antiviral reverse transcriptase Drt3a [Phaeobacter inhibens]MDO6755363.1 antiviral reverse transcriptase Drt3a [Phaeobacter inhibens]